MPDTFYTDFDFATWDDGPADPLTDDQRKDRSAFQVDRDRVVFSFAFRRLQSKTQVFQSGEYDFYRTRLTHSLEVARIARSIGEWLRRGENGVPVDLDLLEAIGLAHDLGHPPYGHIGERKLNELMADWGGFEGNAQTLRILTRTMYERDEGTSGMRPTRAFLDGVLKYKTLRREAGEFPENHFIYDDQGAIRDFVFDGKTPPSGLDLNKRKSLECQIMDWADDTAYSLHDIVDGAKAGFLTGDAIQAWAREIKGHKEHGWMAECEHLDWLIKTVREKKLESRFAGKVGAFIHACRLERADNFLSGDIARHAWHVAIDPEVQRECAFYKKLALDVIFRSTRIQQIEFKGGVILERLFDAFATQYLPSRKSGRALKLLPAAAHRWVEATEDEAERARLLCDHLASLTDTEAARLYKRLYDPDFGSITDLL